MSVLSLARAHVDQQATLMQLLVGELAELWRLMFGSRPASTADTTDLVEVLSPLVGQYGRASATVAQEFYQQARAEAGVSGTFRPPFIEPAPAQQLRAVTGWAVNPNRSRPSSRSSAPPRSPGASPGGQSPPRDPATTPIDLDRLAQRQLDDLTAAIPRVARQPGRATVEESVVQDPRAVGWARITAGPNPCAFCIMIASRGAVYVTEKGARNRPGTRDAYHDRCRCDVIPVWKDNPAPLPQATVDAINLWYDFAAYFTGKDALNALSRALDASRSGRDPELAVFGEDGRPTRGRSGHEARRRKALAAAEGSAAGAPDSATDPRYAAA